jgi:hypothetical protein
MYDNRLRTLSVLLSQKGMTLTDFDYENRLVYYTCRCGKAHLKRHISKIHRDKVSESS